MPFDRSTDRFEALKGGLGRMTKQKKQRRKSKLRLISKTHIENLTKLSDAYFYYDPAYVDFFKTYAKKAKKTKTMF